MPRRVSLPGAAELFRSTTAATEHYEARPEHGVATGTRTAGPASAEARRRSTGRVRHDEKITVYVSTDELLALETARLALRSHGISADRGRLVREAVAIALADLEARQQDSALFARLTD
ncbi:hypothetical protein [Acidipropionibacterium virtanenii]|uniref:Uncharacterized protein n=1 Tax=Acidipropionibacterium virtanenii TaxID=2057246 RepID=A0A344UTH2_9ACTN|nr:hypothetical protein [Acidipropionibacterium virtanenii]AXE38570.1 hypothetical protein JS278_01399 [Acidipropionibacterium virtanenii]